MTNRQRAKFTNNELKLVRANFQVKGSSPLCCYLLEVGLQLCHITRLTIEKFRSQCNKEATGGKWHNRQQPVRDPHFVSKIIAFSPYATIKLSKHAKWWKLETLMKFSTYAAAKVKYDDRKLFWGTSKLLFNTIEIPITLVM